MKLLLYFTRYYLCLSLKITFIFHLILPLSLPLFVDPPLEQSPATTLQLPDEEGHDVVALLLEESKTSGAEENLENVKKKNLIYFRILLNSENPNEIFLMLSQLMFSFG
jgi:hypothetical protein